VSHSRSAVLTTDLTLSVEEVIRIYAIRWDIRLERIGNVHQVRYARQHLDDFKIIERLRLPRFPQIVRAVPARLPERIGGNLGNRHVRIVLPPVVGKHNVRPVAADCPDTHFVRHVIAGMA
jgi:hypothetical protein